MGPIAPAAWNGAADYAASSAPCADLDKVPAYLSTYYSWAYIHPYGVALFERQWLVNLIWWGNYRRLRNAALAALGKCLSGATLQVACVYGKLSVGLAGRAAAGHGTLDIVDVLPIQLQNLSRKLPADTRTRLLAMDSTQLRLPDHSCDRALLFFLLHEQPLSVRHQTLCELFRVVKPGKARSSSWIMPSRDGGIRCAICGAQSSRCSSHLH